MSGKSTTLYSVEQIVKLSILLSTEQEMIVLFNLTMLSEKVSLNHVTVQGTYLELSKCQELLFEFL